MNELESALEESVGGSSDKGLMSLLEKAVASGIITNEQAESMKALK